MAETVPGVIRVGTTVYVHGAQDGKDLYVPQRFAVAGRAPPPQHTWRCGTSREYNNTIFFFNEGTGESVWVLPPLDADGVPLPVTADTEMVAEGEVPSASAREAAPPAAVSAAQQPSAARDGTTTPSRMGEATESPQPASGTNTSRYALEGESAESLRRRIDEAVARVKREMSGAQDSAAHDANDAAAAEQPQPTSNVRARLAAWRARRHQESGVEQITAAAPEKSSPQQTDAKRPPSPHDDEEKEEEKEAPTAAANPSPTTEQTPGRKEASASASAEAVILPQTSDKTTTSSKSTIVQVKKSAAPRPAKPSLEEQLAAQTLAQEAADAERAAGLTEEQRRRAEASAAAEEAERRRLVRQRRDMEERRLVIEAAELERLAKRAAERERAEEAREKRRRELSYNGHAAQTLASAQKLWDSVLGSKATTATATSTTSVIAERLEQELRVAATTRNGDSRHPPLRPEDGMLKSGEYRVDSNQTIDYGGGYRFVGDAYLEKAYPPEESAKQRLPPELSAAVPSIRLRHGQGTQYYPGDQRHQSTSSEKEARATEDAEQFFFFRGTWARDQREGAGVLSLPRLAVSGYWARDLLDGPCTVQTPDMKATVYLNEGEIRHAEMAAQLREPRCSFSGVVSSTAAGRDSTERQYLFPVGEVRLASGDHIEWAAAAPTHDGNNSGKNGAKERKTSGLARVQFANGDSYEGPIRHMRLEGEGGVFRSSRLGLEYYGSFRNGLPHGAGAVFFTRTGNVYSGSFAAGQFDGPGAYLARDKYLFDGDWRAGVLHGRAKFLVAPTTTAPPTAWEGQVAHGHQERGGSYCLQL